MSSGGEALERSGETNRKKRRVGRACDVCRQKKVRCDGEQRPGLRCSNCMATDDKCTFLYEAPKRRLRPKGYTERLEKRIAQLERMLNEKFPGTDLSRDFDAALEESAKQSDDEYYLSDEDEDVKFNILRLEDRDRDFTYAIPPLLGRPPSLASNAQLSAPATPFDSTFDANMLEEDADVSDDEFTARKTLPSTMKFGSGFDFDPGPSSSGSAQNPTVPARVPSLERRFFGKSSTLMMLPTAVNLRKDFMKTEGIAPQVVPFAVTEPPSPDIYSGQHDHSDSHDEPEGFLPCGCPEYGIPHPWVDPPVYHPFVFPHDRLMRELIDLYFEVHNDFIPLLHRPTFERAIKAGKHHESVEFGEVVLLVCAVGSRWSGDRGVLAGIGNDDGTVSGGKADATATSFGGDGYEGDEEEDWHSAGWKWFKQIYIAKKIQLHERPSVHDLQRAVLCALYMRGSSVPEASRFLMGVGLRAAQDMGVHRKKFYSSPPNAAEEQLKRAFWALVWLDGTLSPNLGHVCGIQHEDFDLDLPIECDDEYWEADPPFVQPAGKPSKITYFNCLLRLNQIQTFATRTLYSTSKSKTILGFVGPQWEERILAELDGALAQWKNSIPQHLLWDIRNPHPVFMIQSALLQVAHSAIKITIHRPFISKQRENRSTPFAKAPSMEACVNAARSCVHVIDILAEHLGYGSSAPLGVLSQDVFPMLTAGIVLMLYQSVMSETQHPDQRDMVKEMRGMADTHRIMEVLNAIESRWHPAGRIWDMLYGLAVARSLPLPSSSHTTVLRSTTHIHRLPSSAGSSQTHFKYAGFPLHLRTQPANPAVSGPGHGHRRTVSQTSLDAQTDFEADTGADVELAEFDLTPSVFAMPPPPHVAPPPSAYLDSVFAPHFQATETCPETDFPSTSSHGQFTGSGATGEHGAPPPAEAIVAEVLDTIQARQSSWGPAINEQYIDVVMDEHRPSPPDMQDSPER